MRRLVYLFLVLFISCGLNQPEITKIEISPRGGASVTEATATITAEGSGDCKVNWIRTAYGINTVEETEDLTVDADQKTYTSTLTSSEAFRGWYWIVVNASDDTLAVSDSIWYSDVEPLIPSAEFKAFPQKCEVFTIVEFLLYPVQPVSDITWVIDYGDGHIEEFTYETLNQSSYQYKTVGTFTVTVIATNMAGADTVTKYDYITVTPM